MGHYNDTLTKTVTACERSQVWSYYREADSQDPARNPSNEFRFNVVLLQWRSADEMSASAMAASLLPLEIHQRSPHLKRVAVISAPMSVYNEDECRSCSCKPRVDERVNVKLRAVLEWIMERT